MILRFRFRPFRQSGLSAVAVALALALAGGLSAQSVPGADKAKLLEQLGKIEESVLKARSGHNLATIDIIREAASSEAKAVALWIESVRETDFRDRDKKEAEFRDWKDGPGKRLGEPGAAGAIRLQLQFLVLTMRAAGVKTDAERGELLSSVLGFLDDLVRSDKAVLKNKQILETSVLSTPVARRFKLDVTVKPAIEWATTPGDIPGIYETSVLPFLRSRKDAARLQAAWNRRIQQQGALVALQESEFLTKTFREITLPTLEWGQARDQFLAGSPTAASKMLLLIQQNQTHKDAHEWIGELKGLLEGEPAPATPAPAAPVAAAAPADPAAGAAGELPEPATEPAVPPPSAPPSVPPPASPSAPRPSVR
jgi:hypothetical protein